MTQSDLTKADFEVTYKVLETLRETQIGVNKALLEDAEYIVELLEDYQ